MHKLLHLLSAIRFEHSIFALPFAYMGAMLAAGGVPAGQDLLWITVAMVGARTLAMALNRMIDLPLDRLNPRTAGWELPAGKLRPLEMALLAAGGLAALLAAAWRLAPVCRWLWPVVVIPFVVYPYTKRFTWGSHWLLGFCLGMAPAGAWLAIRNYLDPRILLLTGAVTCWTAGFDIIYACQDLEFDRAQGLRSVPAAFGMPAALRITAILHALSVAFLLLAGLVFGLGAWYYAALAFAAGALWYENGLVRPDDLRRVDLAFFTLNGWVSMVLMLGTGAALWR